MPSGTTCESPGLAAAMGRKSDLRQIRDCAARYMVSESKERDFRAYVEYCKQTGDRGTLNNRGDFTWEELCAKAEEFLEGIA